VDSQRRTLVAIAICVLIWIAYSTWIMPPPPEVEAPKGDAAGKVEKKAIDEDGGGASAGSSGSSEDGAVPANAAGKVDGRLENPLLALEVTNIGGIIRRAELLSPQFLEEGRGLDLLKLDDQASLAVAFDGESTDFKLPRNAAWEVLEPRGDKRAWNLRYAAPEVEIVSSLVLMEDYEARLTVKVTNKSSQQQAHRLALRSKMGEGAERSQYDVHRGLCATVEDFEDFDQSDVEDEPQRVKGGIRWAGVDSKYFLAAVIPGELGQTCEVRTSDDHDVLTTTVFAKGATLQPGETRSYEYGLYMGTKELERLRQLKASPEANLEEAIDWGWFGGLSAGLGKLMLRLLRWFHQLTGIWGVAIILITVVVKLVTLPLTLRQMNSMKRMREIQPEIEALKTKYADDKMRQAQEMQALFARSGVNPLAGCLPMLVQLPIWIALYAMLATAVELYRESFLWLPDLTKQDPYFITPLAIGGLMFLQTKLQPTPSVDNQQAKMMMWMMPTIFTVMMLFLPSGLGVYIFANILLSLVQTVIQTKPAKPAVAKT